MSSPNLDAPLIGAFLEQLETERGNSTRTRNIRLAAVRSFFHYAALRHPEHASVIQRVLAIPSKRSDQRIVTFLAPTSSRRCSPAPTKPPGPAAATTRCCSQPRKQDCASAR